MKKLLGGALGALFLFGAIANAQQIGGGLSTGGGGGGGGGTVDIDQTTPGTTNGVVINGTLPAFASAPSVAQSGTWNINNVSGTISLPTGAATSALQTTGNTSLSTIAGAITSSVVQSNTKQVNGVTTLAGAGAVGTGAQRVAVGQDTTTIAGSAPGTAGTPSSQVLSVQGVAGGTAQPVSLASQGYKTSVSITRTNDTNAYAAGDVIGTGTSAGNAILTFANAAPAAGEIYLTSAELEIDASAVISGETSYVLYLYSASMSGGSNYADNAAWDLPSGDRAGFIGSVNLGTPVDLGSTMYIRSDGMNAQFTAAGTSIYGYLVTVGAYTPTASRVYKVTLHFTAL